MEELKEVNTIIKNIKTYELGKEELLATSLYVNEGKLYLGS
jgi:hypothetical protein